MSDVTDREPLQADRRVAYGSDSSQFIDVFESSAAAPIAVVMMIHGGFWRARYDLNHASLLCAALARNGMTVANIEYRRVGQPGGGWPGTFEDVSSACQRISQLFPGAPFIICGHSAGGHLALRLASVNTPAIGVVALAPVAVLREAYQLHLSNDAVVEFIGGTPTDLPQVYREACPSQHCLKIPATLIHGADDDVVPLSISRDYMQTRQAHSATLIELPSTGHMELIDPESGAFPIVAGALTDLLR